MKIIRSLTALLIASTMLSGCSAMMPKATPESRDRVLKLAERYEASGTKSLGKSAANRKPLRSGQWVATVSRSKSDPNDVTLQIMKVAALSGNDVTLEFENYAASQQGERMVIQQQVQNFPVTAKTAYTKDEAAKVMGDIQVTGMKIMDAEGRVSQVPVLANPFGSAAANLVQTSVSTGQIQTAPCQNAHFSSPSCMVVPFEVSVLWKTIRGESFAHSEVPIVGYLKTTSNDSDIDVVGFGDSGANIVLR